MEAVGGFDPPGVPVRRWGEAPLSDPFVWTGGIPSMSARGDRIRSPGSGSSRREAFLADGSATRRFRGPRFPHRAPGADALEVRLDRKPSGRRHPRSCATRGRRQEPLDVRRCRGGSGRRRIAVLVLHRWIRTDFRAVGHSTSGCRASATLAGMVHRGAKFLDHDEIMDLVVARRLKKP